MNTTVQPGVKRRKPPAKSHRTHSHASVMYGECLNERWRSSESGRISQSEAKHEAVRIRSHWTRSGKRKPSLELILLEDRLLDERTRNAASATRLKSRIPTRCVVAQEVFTGRVDNISDGVAFLTLFPKDEEPLAAQWPAGDLAKKSIGKSDLFELTMTDSGKAVTSSFQKPRGSLFLTSCGPRFRN